MARGACPLDEDGATVAVGDVAGHGITAAARKYLEPLIRGEAYPGFGRDGLPRYVTLKNVAVPKKSASVRAARGMSGPERLKS